MRLLLLLFLAACVLASRTSAQPSGNTIPRFQARRTASKGKGVTGKGTGKLMGSSSGKGSSPGMGSSPGSSATRAPESTPTLAPTPSPIAAPTLPPSVARPIPLAPTARPTLQPSQASMGMSGTAMSSFGKSSTGKGSSMGSTGKGSTMGSSSPGMSMGMGSTMGSSVTSAPSPAHCPGSAADPTDCRAIVSELGQEGCALSSIRYLCRFHCNACNAVPTPAPTTSPTCSGSSSGSGEDSGDYSGDSSECPPTLRPTPQPTPAVTSLQCLGYDIPDAHDCSQIVVAFGSSSTACNASHPSIRTLCAVQCGACTTAPTAASPTTPAPTLFPTLTPTRRRGRFRVIWRCRFRSRRYGRLSAFHKDHYKRWFKQKVLLRLRRKYRQAKFLAVLLSSLRARSIADELIADLDVEFETAEESSGVYTEASSTSGVSEIKGLVSSSANEAIVDAGLSGAIDNVTSSDVAVDSVSLADESSQTRTKHNYTPYYIVAGVSLFLAVVAVAYVKTRGRNRRSSVVTPVKTLGDVSGPHCAANTWTATNPGVHPRPPRSVRVKQTSESTFSPFLDPFEDETAEAVRVIRVPKPVVMTPRHASALPWTTVPRQPSMSALRRQLVTMPDGTPEDTFNEFRAWRRVTPESDARISGHAATRGVFGTRPRMYASTKSTGAPFTLLGHSELTTDA